MNVMTDQLLCNGLKYGLVAGRGAALAQMQGMPIETFRFRPHLFGETYFPFL